MPCNLCKRYFVVSDKHAFGRNWYCSTCVTVMRQGMKRELGGGSVGIPMPPPKYREYEPDVAVFVESPYETVGVEMKNLSLK